jgi:hypothetical protein
MLLGRHGDDQKDLIFVGGEKRRKKGLVAGNMLD